MRCLSKIKLKHLSIFLEESILKTKLNEFLDQMPVIAAVQENGWKDAIESPAKVIFSLKANLMTVKERIAEAHEHGKLIFVHLDLAEGIGKDKTGVEFLASCGADGILTTRGNLIDSLDKNISIPQQVFVYNNITNTVNVRLVETGIQDMANIEVIKGLDKEEQIVVGPYSAISKELSNNSTVLVK